MRSLPIVAFACVPLWAYSMVIMGTSGHSGLLMVAVVPVLLGGVLYVLLSEHRYATLGLVGIPVAFALLLLAVTPTDAGVAALLLEVSLPVALSLYAGESLTWALVTVWDRVQEHRQARAQREAEAEELAAVPHTTHSMVENVFHSILDEACAARAHFYTWRAFRNQAVMEYREEVRDYRYADYFHVSSAGHYELALLALAKIVDRDPGAAGFRKLRQVLREDGRMDLAQIAQDALEGREELAARIVRTRNHTMIHNQLEPTRSQFFIMSNVSPEEIRDLIDAACDALNRIGEALGYRGRVPPPDRHEEAVVNLLEVVRAGREVHEH